MLLRLACADPLNQFGGCAIMQGLSLQNGHTSSPPVDSGLGSPSP